jgi:hypothetical protein
MGRGDAAAGIKARGNTSPARSIHMKRVTITAAMMALQKAQDRMPVCAQAQQHATQRQADQDEDQRFALA